jgi:hypothetical protein
MFPTHIFLAWTKSKRVIFSINASLVTCDGNSTAGPNTVKKFLPFF